jgi:hypothetical protein
MAKQKRTPGSGRPPSGEFGGLASNFSIRMPAEMRTRLEKAAQRSGRSLGQEMLARLDSSLNSDRNTGADWRSDKFLFKAIRIRFNKLLDDLEPGSKMKTQDFWKAYADMINQTWDAEVGGKVEERPAENQSPPSIIKSSQ